VTFQNSIIYLGPKKPSTYVKLINIVSCGTTPKYEVNPYGEISRAWLLVRGHISATEINVEEALTNMGEVKNPRIEDNPREGDYLDSSKENQGPALSVYIMPVAHIDHYLFSLLLSPTKSCFRRIGTRIVEQRGECKVKNSNKEVVELV
jgi:hypothetical protein